MRWFGGVPRELLFDQMRSVVVSDGRADGGELVLNAEFLRFASHWGRVFQRDMSLKAGDVGERGDGGVNGDGTAGNAGTGSWICGGERDVE